MSEESFLKEMKWAFSDIQGSSSLSLDRNRPYDAQPHTHQGQRGETLVEGLTMRDITDCIVMGCMDAAGVDREIFIQDDLYSLDWDDIDPVAVIQNAVCRIEKMMGIYPNVPGMKPE